MNKYTLPTTVESHESRLALSMREAALRIGVSVGFLALEKQRGRLRTRKVGRRRLVLLADLEAWLRGDEGSDGPAA